MVLRRIKLLQIGLVSFIGLYILFGISSLLWSETEGRVLDESKVNHSYKERYMGKGAYRPAGSYNVQNMTYEYTVNNRKYTNSMLCICLPVGINYQINSDRVTVYYLPFSPGIAVVSPGPYFTVPVILGVIALGLSAVSSFLQKFQIK
ncbi:DUF3592 domain-containing protein [Pleionea sediminis]|uniref:DUF3592 domain-containing protein n=1 Tax=Pleionea sediminis TaxID=2569479 RepID=UPI0011855BBC|nr:DUF3592 domain-containing protein [Pleionea sediminis]